MARLKARWAREKEEARITEMNRKTVKVYTIQTTNEEPPSLFKDDEIDFDNWNLTEVIKFLQKLSKSPDASKLNIAFTKHITDALIKAREEKLETSIPRKLEDGWEPTIKMKINDFDCNAMILWAKSLKWKILLMMLKFKKLELLLFKTSLLNL